MMSTTVRGTKIRAAVQVLSLVLEVDPGRFLRGLDCGSCSLHTETTSIALAYVCQVAISGGAAKQFDMGVWLDSVLVICTAWSFVMENLVMTAS